MVCIIVIKRLKHCHLSKSQTGLEETQSQDLIRDNAELMTNTTTNLHARFESASNTKEIAADEYRMLLRKLNNSVP